MTQSHYPESEKLIVLNDQIELIWDFLQKLEDQGIDLCYTGREYEYPEPVLRSNTDIIYDFLGIDSKKLEQERRSMLVTLAAHSQ